MKKLLIAKREVVNVKIYAAIFEKINVSDSRKYELSFWERIGMLRARICKDTDSLKNVCRGITQFMMFLMS